MRFAPEKLQFPEKGSCHILRKFPPQHRKKKKRETYPSEQSLTVSDPMTRVTIQPI